MSSIYAEKKIMHPRLVDEGKTCPLDSCSSLQVLFDLCCVFAVEPLRLLVELGVPLVNIVDVGVVVVGPASAVLGPLLDPDKSQIKAVRWRIS